MMPTKPFSAKAAAFAVFAVLVVASIAPARASDKSLDALTRKVTSTMSRSLAKAVRDHNQNYERRVVLEGGEGDKKEGDKMGDRNMTGYPEGLDDKNMTGYPGGSPSDGYPDGYPGGDGQDRPTKPFRMQKDLVCKSLEAGPICGSYDAKDACVKDKRCTFHEDDGECGPSDDLNLERAFGAATERYMKVAIPASTACSNAGTNETACGKDTACTFKKMEGYGGYCMMTPMSKDAVKKLFPEDAMIGELIGEMFQCGGTEDEAKCTAAKACKWDADEKECGTDEKYGETFITAQYPTCTKAAAASAPSTCSVYKQIVQCDLQDEKSCTKKCKWDKEEGKCDVSGGDAEFTKMALPYLIDIIKAGEECGALDKAKCVASPKCVYEVNNTECSTSDLTVAEAMTKTSKDPALTAYVTAAKQAGCADATTADACKAKGAGKCTFDKKEQTCATSTKFAGGLMACACSGFGVECKGEKPSAADLTAKKQELEKRKKELEEKKAALAKQAEAAKKKQADAKAAKKKSDEELAAKKAAQAEKKAAFEAKKAAAAEKRAAAIEKKKAADEKKEAMLAKITDAKAKKKAKLAAEAAIAGAKIKKFAVDKLAADDAEAACASMCTTMKVDCTLVVCEATAVTARRHLLAGEFAVDLQVNTAEVDVAAAEQSLADGGVTATTEDLEPQAVLDAAGADSTEFKDVAATAATAEAEAATAETEEKAAETEATAADAEVAAAETAATEAATAVTEADEEVADTEAEVAETTASLTAADEEITATAALVTSVTPSPPPSPPPAPPPVLLSGGAGVAAQITTALVAAIVVLAALA